jgi:hypothetical protein
MDIEIARKIYDQIELTNVVNLKLELIKTAILYSRIRTDWYMATKQERIDMDVQRTLLHNSFIDACNILSRNMVNGGEDASWRTMLGDDRKQIGDFACYLHCILGVMSR